MNATQLHGTAFLPTTTATMQMEISQSNTNYVQKTNPEHQQQSDSSSQEGDIWASGCFFWSNEVGMFMTNGYGTFLWDAQGKQWIPQQHQQHLHQRQPQAAGTAIIEENPQNLPSTAHSCSSSSAPNPPDLSQQHQSSHHSLQPVHQQQAPAVIIGPEQVLSASLAWLVEERTNQIRDACLDAAQDFVRQAVHTEVQDLSAALDSKLEEQSEYIRMLEAMNNAVQEIVEQLRDGASDKREREVANANDEQRSSRGCNNEQCCEEGFDGGECEEDNEEEEEEEDQDYYDDDDGHLDYLSDQVDNLHWKCDCLHNDDEALRKEHTLLGEKHNLLNSEHDATRANVLEHEISIKKILERLDAVEKRSASSPSSPSADTRALQTRLNRAEAENKELRETVSGFRARLDKVESENKELREAVSSFKPRLSKLEKKDDNCSKGLSRGSDDKERLDKLESESERLRKALAECKTDKLISRLDKIQTRQDKLDAENKELRESVASCKTNVSQCLAHAQECMKQSRDATEPLNKAVKNTAEALRGMQDGTKELVERVAILTTAVRGQKDAIVKMNDRLKEAEASVRDHNDVILPFKGRLKALVDDMKDKTPEEAEKCKAQALSSTRGDIKKWQDGLNESVRSCTAAQEKMKADICKMREKQAALDGIISHYMKQCGEIYDEVQGIQTVQADAKEEMQKMCEFRDYINNLLPHLIPKEVKEKASKLKELVRKENLKKQIEMQQMQRASKKGRAGAATVAAAASGEFLGKEDLLQGMMDFLILTGGERNLSEVRQAFGDVGMGDKLERRIQEIVDEKRSEAAAKGGC